MFRPWNIGTPRLDLGWNAARSFRNDLEATGHGVKVKLVVAETLIVEAMHEALRQMDVVAHVVKPTNGSRGASSLSD